MVVSLEVAEHLPINCTNSFVKSLVNCGDAVLFSAATPNQGDLNRINEQTHEYWIEKFKFFRFKAFDLIRPQIRNNPWIDSWYSQNILVFVNTQ